VSRSLEVPLAVLRAISSEHGLDLAWGREVVSWFQTGSPDPGPGPDWPAQTEPEYSGTSGAELYERQHHTTNSCKL
jgi:hypothetical protein